MLYRTLFPRDLFAELDRLQRVLRQSGEFANIRGGSGSGFPALNIGSTPNAVEIYAFVPGVDPAAIDVQIEKGVLSIAGERKLDYPAADEKSAVHFDERFAGRFRRVVSLPEDIDVDAVSARYRDGVLHLNIPRRAASQPRRINIQ